MYGRRLNTPKEHQDMYKKQCEVWYSVIVEIRLKYGIIGLQAIVGSKTLSIEIEIYNYNGTHVALYPNKKLIRKDYLTTNIQWLKEQFVKYIKDQLLLSGDAIPNWKIGRSYEVEV